MIDCLNGLAGRVGLAGLIPPEVCIFNGLPLGANFVFTGDNVFSAAGVFLGDGEGGNTAGSFAKNVLTGVHGLGVEFFLSVMGLAVGDISSGKFAKFSRRRTSYTKVSTPLERANKAGYEGRGI